jgi:hypothetical protein
MTTIPASRPGARPPRKYGNKPCVVSGLKFDSKREASRHAALTLLERAGRIRNLRRQVPYVIIPAMRIPGDARATPATKYIADFVYEAGPEWATVVEDSKGMKTPEYRMKRKLMWHVHGIAIKET